MHLCTKIQFFNNWKDSEDSVVHPLFIVFIEVCNSCCVELHNIVMTIVDWENISLLK